MLISNIRKLVNLGNTVIVVEHDPEIMRHADHILDIGPDAGKRGGAIVFSGTYDKILKDKGSITGAYLSGKKEVSVTPKKRRISEKICIRGAEENNLKKVDVDIPL
jgi:excinuclease ABC subunit A